MKDCHITIADLQTFLNEERTKYQLKGLIMSLSNCHGLHVLNSGTSLPQTSILNRMHYRIGGQGITILTTIFLILVDRRVFHLDDIVGHYLPRVPNGHLITLQMLCNMTSGLPDYINDPVVSQELDTHVFKQWSREELLEVIYHSTPLYPPGTTFYFGHLTNMLLLGTIIELKTHKSIRSLLQSLITKPLYLHNTNYVSKTYISKPVLQAYTKTRMPHYENSTYWNPSWGVFSTAINTNAHDMNRIAQALGSGQLVSRRLYRTQMSPVKGLPLTDPYYGMGVVIGNFNLESIKTNKYPYPIIWSNERFNGYTGIWAYIPRYKLCITFETNTDNNVGLQANTFLQDLLDQFTLKQLRSVN